MNEESIWLKQSHSVFVTTLMFLNSSSSGGPLFVYFGNLSIPHFSADKRDGWTEQYKQHKRHTFPIGSLLWNKVNQCIPSHPNPFNTKQSQSGPSYPIHNEYIYSSTVHIFTLTALQNCTATVVDACNVPFHISMWHTVWPCLIGWKRVENISMPVLFCAAVSW